MALTGASLFIILMVVANLWGRRALKILSKKDRLKLVEILIHFAKIGMAPLIIISVAYWILMIFFISYTGSILLYLYFGSLLAHFITLYILIVRKLRSMNFPPRYVRDASIGITIQYLGIASLVSGILLELWSRHV